MIFYGLKYFIQNLCLAYFFFTFLNLISRFQYCLDLLDQSISILDLLFCSWNRNSANCLDLIFIVPFFTYTIDCVCRLNMWIDVVQFLIVKIDGLFLHFTVILVIFSISFLHLTQLLPHLQLFGRICYA